MKIDVNELAFINQHKPHSFYSNVAIATGRSRGYVFQELTRVKENYDDVVISEARKILKAVTGLEYKAQ